MTTYVAKYIKDRSQGSPDGPGQELGLGRASVSTTAGILYQFYVDFLSDLKYRKSTDGGATWGAEVNLVTGTIRGWCAWPDKWTPGDAGTLIHLWYIDGNNVVWRSFETATDTLNGAITIFAGASATFAVMLSGAKMRGANLLCAFTIDGGTEVGCYRSVDAGANWTSRASPVEAAQDIWWLQPGNYADNQDADLLFWDVSANELSLKFYDNSADSWAETSIDAAMTEAAPTIAGPQLAAGLRHSDGHLIVVAWSAYAAAGADLRCWDINGSGSITAKTNVVTDSAASILAALFLNQATGAITVWYVGKSDASEAVGSTTNLYSKTSTDGGATWGTETLVQDATFAGNIKALSVDLGSGSGALAVPAVIRLDGGLQHHVFAHYPLVTAGGLAAPIRGGLIV